MRLTKENILKALDWSIDYYKKSMNDGVKNKFIKAEIGGKIKALEEFREDIEDQLYFYDQKIFEKLKDI